MTFAITVRLICGLLVLTAPLDVFAQAAREPASRDLRRDARLTGQDIAELRAVKALQGVDWKLTVGTAATKAENGDTRWAVPFQLRARFNEGRSALKVSGDGYSRIQSKDGTASGFNDLNLIGTQLLSDDFLVEAGVTLPAGGDIGSDEGRERIGLVYNRVLSRRWDAEFHVRLTRYDADPKPGVARIRRQGLVQAAYHLDAPHTHVLFQLLRSYRPGSSSASQGALAYEFPLQQKRRPAVGSLSFTRGLTSGARDNTVEFDVSLRF